MYVNPNEMWAFLFVSGSHTQWGLTYFLRLFLHDSRVVGLCSIQFTFHGVLNALGNLHRSLWHKRKTQFPWIPWSPCFLTETISSDWYKVQYTLVVKHDTETFTKLALKPVFIRDVPICSHDFAICSHILHMFILYFPARSDDTGSAPAPRRAG